MCRGGIRANMAVHLDGMAFSKARGWPHHLLNLETANMTVRRWLLPLQGRERGNFMRVQLACYEEEKKALARCEACVYGVDSQYIMITISALWTLTTPVHWGPTCE
jgi:hypothetical protein